MKEALIGIVLGLFVVLLFGTPMLHYLEKLDDWWNKKLK